jgi:prevent-host-death family protein
MTTFNIHEAKTQLSRLIERVSAGEEVVIAKAGKPVARLVPAIATGVARKPGSLKGKIRIGRNFNAPLPDAAIAVFEGRAARK